MATTLTHSQLRDAIAGDGIGLRARIALEPLGGSGDKIFPASYGTGPAADSKYAMEKRRVDGATVLRDAEMQVAALDEVARLADSPNHRARHNQRSNRGEQ